MKMRKVNLKFHTSLWRTSPHSKVYHFQTTDPTINRKIKRRKGFIPLASGYNSNIWVYKTTYYSSREAERSLKNITKCKELKKINDILYVD